MSEKINKTAEKETISNCKRAISKRIFFSPLFSIERDLFRLSYYIYFDPMINSEFEESEIFVQFEGGFSAGSDSFISSFFFFKHSYIFYVVSFIFTMLNASHRKERVITLALSSS